MNISSLFGVLLGMGVLYGALSGATDNLQFFLDLHGILIVCGGTMAAASISFPIGKVLQLTKVFFLRVLARTTLNYQDTINQILELGKKASLGVSGLKDGSGDPASVPEGSRGARRRRRDDRAGDPRARSSSA